MRRVRPGAAGTPECSGMRRVRPGAAGAPGFAGCAGYAGCARVRQVHLSAPGSSGAPGASGALWYAESDGCAGERRKNAKKEETHGATESP